MNLRQHKAFQTKKKILNTALELFNQKGFSNVTVDEIVDKTGTSKGAFYNHFKSKHDIFLEKFKEIDSYYVNEVMPKLDPTETVKERLKKFFYLQMAYIEEDMGWDVIRTIYEQELNPERESFFLIPDRPLYQILYSLCKEAEEKEEFTAQLTPAEMVIILARVIRGILYDWSLHKGKYSLKDEQEPLFEVVLKGLMK